MDSPASDLSSARTDSARSPVPPAVSSGFVRGTGRLFVSDLDGTLLDAQGLLSDFAREALKRFHQKGIPFTVASGRMLDSIRCALGPVPLHFPVISSDGALVSRLDDPTPLWVQGMETATLESLLRDCRDAGLHPMLDVWDGNENFMGFSGVHNPGMAYFHGYKQTAHRYLHRVDREPHRWAGETVISVTLIDTRERIGVFRGHFDRKFSTVFRSDSVELDAVHPDAGSGWSILWMQDRRSRKEVALANLLEMLDWKPEVTVFGDEMNDLGLFKSGWHSVAVANARREILQSARQVIGPHFEDSVVRFIMETCLD